MPVTALRTKFAGAVVLSLAALAFSAASTPAEAGGRGYYGGGYYYGKGGFDRGYYGRGFHHRGYYGRGYYGRGHYGRGYYGPGFDHGHHYRRGGLSGGEAALIGLGIIGGAIIIDRALDDRRDDRYYEDRRDRYYDDRRRAGAFDDDYYYQRDARPYEDDRDPRFARGADFPQEPGFADREPDLLGAGRPDGSLGRVAVNAAFRECVAETRGAAGAGGLTVAMPGAPTEVEELADGSVRMVAQFRASNARGQQWTRRFVCEADEAGVRFLQVD